MIVGGVRSGARAVVNETLAVAMSLPDWSALATETEYRVSASSPVRRISCLVVRVPLTSVPTITPSVAYATVASVGSSVLHVTVASTFDIALTCSLPSRIGGSVSGAASVVNS